MDADVLIYIGSVIGQETTDWGDGVITTSYDFGKSKSYIDVKTKSITARVIKYLGWKGAYKVTMCLSSHDNFRKVLYPLYKANRIATPKPKLYPEVREYTEQNYEYECWDTLEADDVLGCLATSMENTVVCSIDKDMSTIRDTIFYNFKKDTFEHTTPESAKFAHLYQTLIGDSTDNYRGCPGIGPVKAKKALDMECSWDNVVSLYESKGLTEVDALLQARVAKILTTELWSPETGVILWNPMQLNATEGEETICLH